MAEEDEGFEGAIRADWAIGAEGALGSEGVIGAEEDKGAAIYLMLDGGGVDGLQFGESSSSLPRGGSLLHQIAVHHPTGCLVTQGWCPLAALLHQ